MRFVVSALWPVLVVLVVMLCGCQQDSDKDMKARLDTAMVTALDAVDRAKAAEGRIEKLEAELANLRQKLEQNDEDAERYAHIARKSAIDARDAAERAETAALKAEKIFERSLMK